MSLDTPKLFLVHQMKETRLKLSNLAARRRYRHGLLSTSQQDMIFLFRQYGIIDRTVCHVCFQMMQIDNIIELGRKVGGGGDEQSLVKVEGDAIDLLLVREEFFHLLSRDGIIQADGTIVKGYKQCLVEVEPYNVGGFDHLPVRLFGQVNLQPGDIRQIISRDARRSIVNGNLCIVIDKWVIDSGEHLRSLGPGDSPGRSVVGECVDDLTGLAVPEIDGGVGGGGEETG
mmetsp:Transcript_2027/g.1923  ORF Transcript_2027/g.1923 Transcript_2027/m.1923 type:complete len:229 (+) Transcript_2027:258-944(+)